MHFQMIFGSTHNSSKKLIFSEINDCNADTLKRVIFNLIKDFASQNMQYKIAENTKHEIDQ
jgi:hypothetical protein